MSLEQLSLLLEGVSFHAELEVDENGEFVGTVDEIEDIVVCGESRKDALLQIAKCLMEYAEDYLTDASNYTFMRRIVVTIFHMSSRSHYKTVLMML